MTATRYGPAPYLEGRRVRNVVMDAEAEAALQALQEVLVGRLGRSLSASEVVRLLILDKGARSVLERAVARGGKA